MWTRAMIATLSVAVGLAPTAKAFAADGVDKDRKVVKFAGYDACTGKYGDYGAGDKRGQEVAVEEINNAGGIQAGPLKGYKLELTFFDDRGDPKEDASIARQVSSGDFLAALGPTMSSCALAATPVYARNGVPNIVTYANATTITEQGFKNVVRLTYTTKAMARTMAETVKSQFKKDSVAILSENQDYGQQLRKAFTEAAKELGIKVASESVVTPGQDVDFSSVLMKVKESNPGVLMLFLTYNEAGMVSKQARDMGFKVPIYAPDSISEPKFFALAGDLKDIYIMISPSIDFERPAGKQLKNQWNKKYADFPPMAAVYGYDAVKVAAAVVAQGGVTRQEFVKHLRSVEVEGVGNPLYKFDAAGEGKAPPFLTLPAQQFYDETIKKK